MNKKTFTLALIFLLVTLVWLGIVLYWTIAHRGCAHAFDVVVSVLFVAAGIAMVCNEFKKKKRRHLEEVNRFKIP